MTTGLDKERLEQLVNEALRALEYSEQSYRKQALKLYPHVCSRCGRAFDHRNLREPTAHHRDNDHDNNPSDGCNWEHSCQYCHDNEYQRRLETQ
jgi:hypothetical protein